jgi:lysophospholipase L1-like esterase
MLGTNDFQSMHNYNVWHSAQGIAALVSAIRNAPIEPGMPVPQILVVAPPPIRTPRGPIAPKFEGAEAKSIGLAEAYKQVCSEHDCAFLDAGMVTSTSHLDGVHLDADQHAMLGLAIAKAVEAILAKNIN